MQAYINFLVEDIVAAHRPEDYFKKSRMKSSEEKLEEALAESELIVHQDSFPGFAKYCGLNPINFSPVEKLSDSELEQIVKVFIPMMESWNLMVHFPEDLPLVRQYVLLMGILVKPAMIIQHGFYGYDFCTGNPEGCELGEYCPCLKREYYNP